MLIFEANNSFLVHGRAKIIDRNCFFTQSEAD